MTIIKQIPIDTLFKYNQEPIYIVSLTLSYEELLEKYQFDYEVWQEDGREDLVGAALEIGEYKYFIKAEKNYSKPYTQVGVYVLAGAENLEKLAEKFISALNISKDEVDDIGKYYYGERWQVVRETVEDGNVVVDNYKNESEAIGAQKYIQRKYEDKFFVRKFSGESILFGLNKDTKGIILERQTTYAIINDLKNIQSYKVNYISKQEFFIESENFEGIEIQDEHPLLEEYEYTFTKLYVSTATKESKRLSDEIYQALKVHYQGWRTDNYLNTEYNIVNILSEGQGMLYSGPPSGADVVELILKKHNIKFNAMYRGKVKEGKYKVLFLGKNYIVAKDFNVEEFEAPESKEQIKAIKTDWKTKPMPIKRAELGYEQLFTDLDVETLMQGIIPKEMEDKWFVYFDNGWLYLHRSWTGHLIYWLKLDGSPSGVSVVESWVNRDLDEYNFTDTDYDREMLNFLLNTIMLSHEVPFPVMDKDSEKSEIFQHHITGTAHPHEIIKASFWKRLMKLFKK